MIKITQEKVGRLAGKLNGKDVCEVLDFMDKAESLWDSRLSVDGRKKFINYLDSHNYQRTFSQQTNLIKGHIVARYIEKAGG